MSKLEFNIGSTKVTIEGPDVTQNDTGPEQPSPTPQPPNPAPPPERRVKSKEEMTLRNAWEDRYFMKVRTLKEISADQKIPELDRMYTALTYLIDDGLVVEKRSRFGTNQYLDKRAVKTMMQKFISFALGRV